MKSFEGELRLNDARRLDPGPQDVLLSGHVMGAGDAIQTVQVVSSRVVELVLPGPGEAVLHSLVTPQPLH